MIEKEKVAALVDVYIEIARENNYNDSDIIDTLVDIFERKELESLGFKNFIRDYFDSEDDATEAVPDDFM